MSDEEEDISMLPHRALGTVIATREIATTMAEMIIKKLYGDDHYKTQLPLTITDGGNRWIIEGSRSGEDYPVPPGGIHMDKVMIEILKVNCQVLKLAHMAW